VAFPRPDPGGLDWSFSGLKTAVKAHLASPRRASDADVAASFQEAVADVLCARVNAAIRQTGVRRVAAAGGVAANSRLRERLLDLPAQVYLPPRSRCTDNGAMIALAGRLHLMAGRRDALSVGARPNWTPGAP
jgi:N6-L-threonylcarbamoyladenine synthase